MKKTSIVKVLCGALLLTSIIFVFSGCANTQLNQTARDAIAENADKLADLVDEATHYRADCSISIQVKSDQGEVMKNKVMLTGIAGEEHEVIAKRIEET